MRTINTFNKALAVVGAAALAWSLAACGSNSSETATSATSAAESDGTMSEEITEETAPALPEAVPAGYVEVTAPNSGLSFAVPETWESSPMDLSDPEFEAILQDFADKTGFTVEQLKAQSESLELVVSATEPDATGFAENLNVNRNSYPATSTPTEAEVEGMISQFATFQSYEVLPTAMGDAAVGYYEVSSAGVTARGGILFVPTGDGEMYLVTVSTSTTERTKELVDVIAATVHF